MGALDRDLAVLVRVGVEHVAADIALEPALETALAAKQIDLLPTDHLLEKHAHELGRVEREALHHPGGPHRPRFGLDDPFPDRLPPAVVAGLDELEPFAVGHGLIRM